MSTKIQINSLEALERLIGNDTELEIEIRNSVIQKFANKHLKSLATSEVMTKASKAILEQINKDFFTHIKEGYGMKTYFKKEILDSLKSTLELHARQELRNIVSDIVEEQKAYDRVEKVVEEKVAWIEEKLAPERLDKILNNLVEKRLKEKFGK